MTVAINTLTQGASTTDGTTFTTGVVAPGPNRLVLLSLAYARTDSVTPAVDSVTGCGLTWVSERKTAYETTGTDRYALQVYRAMGSLPTSGAITISCSAPGFAGCCWSVVEFDAVDTSGTSGSGAVVQSVAISTAGATSLTATLAAFGSANNATFGAFAHEADEGATIGAGFTELHDQSHATPVQALATEWRSDNDTTVNMSWTTSSPAGGIALEINAAVETFGVAVVGQATSYPYLKVEIAFSTDPTSGSPTWTEITQYVLGFSCRRGRQHDLARIEAGTLDARLDNRDRRFDPSYAASPYYPDVLPLRRIRIRASWNSVIYPVWQGYVEA